MVKKLASDAKAQEEEYKMLSEAHTGLVVTGIPSIPKTKEGTSHEAAELLNRLAEDEQSAAAHEQAAADARALEAKERSRAAKELKRAHKLSEYLRNHYH